MITWGFVVSYSDAITVGSLFSLPVNNVTTTFNSTYIGVTGSAGDIVYENPLGVPCYWPSAQTGQIYPIGARRILSSATINGTVRTTAATGMFWGASPVAT